MEMMIDFPGGSRVDAHFGRFTVQTDQPPTASAPSPFDLFLSSIGTCAGVYVLGFCRQRNLPTDGLRIKERVLRNAMSGMVEKIELEDPASADLPREVPGSRDQFGAALRREKAPRARSGVRDHNQHESSGACINSAGHRMQGETATFVLTPRVEWGDAISGRRS